MSGPARGRVVVSGPATRTPVRTRWPVRHELHEHTELGAVYVRSLMRAQFLLALRVTAVPLAVVVGLSVVVASLAGRHARTTSDLLVASRAVSSRWNAAAIGSEYISAAAFLGTAGLVLVYGADVLWLPIGAAAGFLVLQLFVTAPLRRSGAYTVSDFAEWRFGSRVTRQAVSVCVCFIGWFYLLPQFQGAGVTLHAVA